MRARRGERGMSESVQWAVLTPLILLTVLGLIQGGLWLYGRTVAQHAAVAAAEEAALVTAIAGQPEAMAERVASAGGLRDVSTGITSGAAEVTATVSGRMPTFVDLGQTQVTEQATRPRERVTTP